MVLGRRRRRPARRVGGYGQSPEPPYRPRNNSTRRIGGDDADARAPLPYCRGPGRRDAASTSAPGQLAARRRRGVSTIAGGSPRADCIARTRAALPSLERTRSPIWFWTHSAGRSCSPNSLPLLRVNRPRAAARMGGTCTYLSVLLRAPTTHDACGYVTSGRLL